MLVPGEPFKPLTPWQRFRARLQDIIGCLLFRWSVWSGYHTDDGEPIRCPKCHWWKHFDDRVSGTCGDHVVSEYERVCPHCGKVIGHWAYGYWEPPFH